MKLNGYDFVPTNIAVNSKGLIYIYGLGKPDSLVNIFNYSGKFVTEFCSPISKTDWNLSQKALYNHVIPFIDSKDNIWIVFENQPLLRKYDSCHHLIFEREYLTSETKKTLILSNARRKEKIARTKVHKAKKIIRGASCVPVFIEGLVPFKRNTFLLFPYVPLNQDYGIAYELDASGSIRRKLIIPCEGVRYSYYKKGNGYSLYGYWVIPYSYLYAPQSFKVYKYTEIMKGGSK